MKWIQGFLSFEFMDFLNLKNAEYVYNMQKQTNL